MQKEIPAQGSRESHRTLLFCASPEPVKNNNHFTSKNVSVSQYYVPMNGRRMFLLGSLEAESLCVKKRSRNSDFTEVNPKVMVK